MNPYRLILTRSAQTAEEATAALAQALTDADAIVVGVGAGMSTSAGFTYTGERFRAVFGDFIDTYGFTDMYSAGFYPFETPEELWAFWSRYIWCNRYTRPPKDTYEVLVGILARLQKEYFVITTNVDHQFQPAGLPKERLFYTQGDYGLWQCSVPCHARTYDNHDTVQRMMEEQRDMRVPSELVPLCPVCGKPMSMNLRADDTFVEDEGWHEASARYQAFLDAHTSGKVLYLELGVGFNTPIIIKYPFWQRTAENPEATFACINWNEAYTLRDIANRSIVIEGDIDEVLRKVDAALDPEPCEQV